MSDLSVWAKKRQVWEGIFAMNIPVPAENLLYRLLADGANTNINVDGSSTDVEFEYACPEDSLVFFRRCCLTIVDSSITPTKFGGISALTNGLLMQVIDSDTTTVLLDFTLDIQIKKNLDFSLFAGTDAPVTAVAGDDVMEVRWTIGKTGAPLLLTEGQIFRVTVRDNLSAITEFRWMMQGLIFGNGVFGDP